MKKIIWVILLFVLSGCEATLQTIPTEYLLEESKNESIVFGHLIQDWKSWGWAGRAFRRWMQPSMKLDIENIESGESYQIICDQSGFDSQFFVALPAGKYEIRNWSLGNRDINLFGNFYVPSGKVVFIGTIKWVKVEKTVNVFSTSGDLVVEDNFEKSPSHLESGILRLSRIS